MADILTAVTSLVNAAVSWITTFCTAITGQPLLLLFVITSFVGLGVGLIKRLVKI